MNIDIEQLSPGQVYFYLTQTLLPRPIGWVLSENTLGRYNLAPFSFFSAVATDPPLVMFSVSRKADGSSKDTLANIEQRGDFVVHIASVAQMRALDASAAVFPPEVSEVDALKLKVTDFPGSRLPRVLGCPVAYACDTYQLHELAGMKVIYGRVRHMFVDDAVCQRSADGRLKVDAAKVRPLSRLGAGEYMGPGEILRYPPPKSK